MKSLLHSFALSALILLPLAPHPASAQDDSEQAKLGVIGAAAAQALYATHMAVNSLGDAWTAKSYTDDVALSIAGSYEGGIGSMTDSISQLIENGEGLSPEDLESLTEFVECGRLVSAQITSFKGYVKTREPAKAKIFEAKRVAAQARIFAMLGIEDEAAAEPAPEAAVPNTLKFEIIESTMPNGDEGQKGAVVFTRTAQGRAYSVAWAYADGTSDSGMAVAFPDSGRIAVGFGPDVLGVAIYQLDGESVDARWTPYVDDSEIAAYTMTQGENDSVYQIEGDEGGTFELEALEAGTARLVWKLPSGEVAGYGVAEGNYLAAVSVKPGGQSGVAIYTADPKNGTAEGLWTLESLLGKVGKESFRMVGAE